MPHPPILPLDSPDAALSLVGGKGANLAQLTRVGFPVPNGFLVTTQAYDAYVAANDLQASILTTARTVQADDPTALEAASEAIRARFAAGIVPSDLAETLRNAYAELGTPPVAVRSSATAEDLPEMSFAGQQDTYLNVLGDEALLLAVVNCWSSLWTARAIGYRARNGIPPDEVALAVVVQVMAPAKASGVLFTANPLNGKRTEIVIDATFGLGEALVSGQVEPDHYVVAAASGNILSKTLGSKAVSIRAQTGGGTQTLAEDAAGQQALPDAAITALAQLGRRVAEHYGAPQDVEWAWDGGQLHLLQSRPITSLFPVPAGMASEPLRVMFSFGAVQGLLDPITPLGQDAMRAVFAGGASLFGYQYTPETQPTLRTAAERFFVDVTTPVRHPTGRRLLRTLLPIIEPSVARALDTLWDDPRLAPTGRGLTPGALRRLAPVVIPAFARLISSLLRPDPNRARLQRQSEALIAEIQARSDAAATLAQRVALLEEMFRRVFPFIVRNFIPRFGAGMAMLNALRHLTGEGSWDAPNVLEATRGLPHNVTTEMDLALWETARAIKSDPTATEHFDRTDAATLTSEALAGALPTAAQHAVATFLDRYGMRGVAEIDLGRPRWREDPTTIMQSLQSYLRIKAEHAPDATFARGAQAAEVAIEHLSEALRHTRGGWLKSRLVRFAGGRMRALVGLREAPKFFAIRLMGIMRENLLSSGRDLVAAGILSQPDDLFYLRISELKTLAAGAARDWQALIAERRQLYAREQKRRQIPRLLLSDGKAFYEGSGAAAEDGSALTGSPVSPGVVEGVAHVMLDPHGAQLALGEILVCPATDPGWTPLFLAAGGLVMEVGGLMTHGAVVAREYGIPAIVGVHQATTRLKTGQRLRVDGSTGQIVILEE